MEQNRVLPALPVVPRPAPDRSWATAMHAGLIAGPIRHLLAWVSSAMPRLYTRRILGRVWISVLSVLLIVEGIFLADQFVPVLRSALENHARLSDILLMLACASPQIFSLALPVAMLFAVYNVMLRCREDRELLVIASMGGGVRQFAKTLFGVALLAMLTSLVVSGFVEPRLRFAQRGILFEAKYRALRGGISGGQFYTFPNHLVFAGPQSSTPLDRSLFIFEGLTQGSQRVVIADHAMVYGPDRYGILDLMLRDFTSYDFASAPKDSSTEGPFAGDGDLDPHAKPSIVSRVGSYTEQIRLADMLPFKPRGGAISEWTIFELLGLAPSPDGSSADRIVDLAQRLLRGSLCLLAPLLAGVTLAYTTRSTRAFAFPAACGLLLSIDLIGGLQARAIAPHGMMAVLILVPLTIIGVAIVLIRIIIRLQDSIAKPALSRA